ncbi:hypothetical protein ACFFGN_17870 [Kribbella deserti]|uniref:Secreted protein n=1 Tax=Kribbella deserti TaxID=1926257 RepID=A0ABV6QMS6_9ACTN
MKTRVLRTVVGLAAVLGSSLVASPAQADDGPVSVRVYTQGSSGSGGIAKTSVNFLSQTDIHYSNLTVRDVCPGDNLPVRVYVKVVFRDGTSENDLAGSDTNGCGSDGTNLGDFRTDSPFAQVAKAGLRVCVYNSAGNQRCAESLRSNPYL